MHEHSTPVLARARRFVAERLTPAIYRERAPLTLSAVHPARRADPVRRSDGRTVRTVRGREAWGRPWGTVWFHATGDIPAHWTEPGTSSQLVVDLGFNEATPGFQAEGLVYTADGRIVKAIEPRNQRVTLRAPAGSAVEFYVEAAANPDVAAHFDFSPTLLGERDTAGTAPLYRLRRFDLALLDTTVWELVQDFRALTGLVGELPVPSPRRADILPRWSGRWTRWTPTTSPAPRRSVATCSPACCPHRPPPARTASSRSGTRTSTRRGCGRCARPCARSPAPSPTCSS